MSYTSIKEATGMEPYIKLLIVDDEKSIREGIKNLLIWEEEGFKVIGE